MKVKERKESKWTVLETALLLGLAVFLISGVVSVNTQGRMADKVVRIHVLANSDSDADQALKLQVRDAVLVHATALLEGTEKRNDAEQILRRSLPELEKVAEKEIRANGYTYSVEAELKQTEFPTKEYDGFSLPAGRYLALRLIIGEGEGKNWWCVVFPPLCTAAAADVPALAVASGFSEEEVRLITEESGYFLKFKVVELWEILRMKWK